MSTHSEASTSSRPRPVRRGRWLPPWLSWTLFFVGVPLGLVLLGWAWQTASLSRIPDVGAPFDVAAFVRDFPDNLPDDQNAFTFYRRAFDALPRRYRTFADVDVTDDWGAASGELKARVEQARPALAIWKDGTDRDAARYHRLDELSFSTLLDVTQALRDFGRLAVLEGSRREGEGDLAGAWDWYRALLRCSRHSGTHGGLIERQVGISLFEQANPRIRRWAVDPRVDAPLLRRALADLHEADANTPSMESILKLEYWLTSRSLDDPALLRQLLDEQARASRGPPPTSALGRLFWEADPRWLFGRARIASGFEAERTRRIARLVFANRLPQLARPPSGRAPIAIEDAFLFANDPTAPPSANALSPRALARWMSESPLYAASQVEMHGRRWYDRIDREAVERASLIVFVAEQLDRREHGGEAAASPESLVPGGVTPTAPDP